MEERPNLTHDNRQRIENLHQRFRHAQKHFEENRLKTLSPANTNQVFDNVDVLIKHLREIEEQIRANAIQPLNDYERLIPDCQVKLQVSSCDLSIQIQISNECEHLEIRSCLFDYIRQKRKLGLVERKCQRQIVRTTNDLIE